MTSISTPHTLARSFNELHAARAESILVLPNAWDAMSARLVEAAGAKAIATTSAGISWSLGYRDGQGLAREQMIDALRRIVGAVRIPVSADMESGYGTGSLDDITATVRGVLNAGAVGLNLEDAPGSNGELLVSLDRQAERIRAARCAADEAGTALFINARTDTYVKRVGADGERFDETVRRARAYVDAGANGVFVPGVADADIIRRLAAAVGAPLNVIGGPGAPSVPELRTLGVARVSVGPGMVRAIMAHIRRVSIELLESGTYHEIEAQLSSPDANALFPQNRV